MISHNIFITKLKISPQQYIAANKLEENSVPYHLLPYCWSMEHVYVLARCCTGQGGQAPGGDSEE
jgi:hypothetical protein